MSFYQIPPVGTPVKWAPQEPRTIVRFDQEGGLVVLHASANPGLTVEKWLTQPLEVALYGLEASPASGEVPPVLCAQLSGAPLMAAPICLLELGNPYAIYNWLNARPTRPQLRFVLLRLDPRRVLATVETSRRLWTSAWQHADEQLRQRLAQQVLNTEDDDAGLVQAAGRELVARRPATEFFTLASCRLAQEGQLSYVE